MDITSLRLFVRIAQLGGVSRAAADLELSAASASARLAKLEAGLGVRLFHRTTRAISLTADGAAFLPYAENVLEILDQGEAAIGGHTAEPAGTLRMTMPGSFASGADCHAPSSYPGEDQSPSSSRASYASPMMRSLSSNGPTAAFHCLSDTTRVTVPSARSISSCNRNCGRLP
jgi:hypothetical protein